MAEEADATPPAKRQRRESSEVVSSSASGLDTHKPQSMFGEIGSSSLTDEIFGVERYSECTTTNGGNNPPGFNQKGIETHRNYAVDSKQADVSLALDIVPPPPPIESILARRRRYAAAEVVDPVTAFAPYREISCSTESTDDAKVPPDESVQEIARIIQTHGFAVVRNAVPRSIMDKLCQSAADIQCQVCRQLDEKNVRWRCGTAGAHRAEMFRFDEVASRCSGRMDVRYRIDQPPFSDGYIIENTSLMPVIHSILGVGASSSSEASHLPKLLYAGLIFSFPGSDDQPWHQDGMPLFPELTTDLGMPAYALNVFLPLEDEDSSVEAGRTEFIAGSHDMEEDAVMEATELAYDGNTCNEKDTTPVVVGPAMKQGDALLYDYRVCHRGTSNLTGHSGSLPRVRRILYLMYARPWFQEHMNFGKHRLFPNEDLR